MAITLYVRGIEQRAFDDAELVEVLVPREEIPEGMSATALEESDAVARERLPDRAVPSGALDSFAAVEGQALSPAGRGMVRREARDRDITTRRRVRRSSP